MRIGYLVPEYPGQTHGFFRAQIRELLMRGIAAELVSTRPPRFDAPRDSHEAEAMYLFSPQCAGLRGLASRLFRTSWQGIRQNVITLGRSLETGTLTAGAISLLGAALADLAWQRGWDHVHVHSCGRAAAIALAARRLASLPYSLTLHGPLRFYGPGQAAKWQSAEFAILVSLSLRNEVRAQLRGSLPARMLVAPMGVDVTAFRREVCYVPWRADGSARIFCCSRLDAGKGITDLISAAKYLRQRGRSIQLRIAGEDDRGGRGYRRQIQMFIEAESLSAHVELLGAIEGRRVREELERAHVFVLPSCAEGVSVAAMEAMSMEVPVVVTRVGGMHELVTDGAEGILVDPAAPGALADAVDSILLNSATAQRMGLAGRKKVERGFHAGISAAALAGALGSSGRRVDTERCHAFACS